jgi:hypothetical protein
MMLRRPQHVKAALNGQTGQLAFLTPHLLIPDVLPAVAANSSSMPTSIVYSFDVPPRSF